MAVVKVSIGLKGDMRLRLYWNVVVVVLVFTH